MRPNLDFLYFHFDRLNTLCYEGKLPRPEIKLNNRVRSLGLTCARINKLTRSRKIWIEISAKYDLPEAEIIDTLLHEMIHYYIMINRLKDTNTHGTIFRAEMKRLKDCFNLNVTVSYKPSSVDEVIVNPAVRYYCISRDNNGNIYITVVAKSRIFSLWDEMKTFRTITVENWYVGRHPELLRYPKATNGVKFYKITRDKVKELTSRSKCLTRQGSTIYIARNTQEEK